ncbi:WxcM-like protein [Leptospira interrogans str. L1207]|nr:WxcM-like protein [Leptospira interrogans str. L1207]
MKNTTVSDLRKIKFWQHSKNGVLSVFEGSNENSVPFSIARVFTISGVLVGGVRGNHAHRKCIQLVVCLVGSVTIEITDGRNKKEIVLSNSSIGLLIPAGLWNTIIFNQLESVIAVFCDRIYEEDDYLRDPAEFLIYKGILHA